jgi:hypothetical protein
VDYYVQWTDSIAESGARHRDSDDEDNPDDYQDDDEDEDPLD